MNNEHEKWKYIAEKTVIVAKSVVDEFLIKFLDESTIFFRLGSCCNYFHWNHVSRSNLFSRNSTTTFCSLALPRLLLKFNYQHFTRRNQILVLLVCLKLMTKNCWFNIKSALNGCTYQLRNVLNMEHSKEIKKYRRELRKFNPLTK